MEELVTGERINLWPQRKPSSCAAVGIDQGDLPTGRISTECGLDTSPVTGSRHVLS
jgi:hypothetical protein